MSFEPPTVPNLPLVPDASRPPARPLLPVFAATGLVWMPDEPVAPEPPDEPTVAPADHLHVEGYEVLGELGRGSMGVVYKARQRLLNRPVALKMVLTGSLASPTERMRFLVEAEMIARLQHPHIVQIHEVGECRADGLGTPIPFFALEYVEGGSLADRLRGRAWPPHEAAELVEQLARAVHYAHQQGVIHRDLKPANILLASGGCQPPAGSPSQRPSQLSGGVTPPLAECIPKITDFGLAKQMCATAGLTETGAIMGTPGYMAPEQAAGRGKEVGPAADIYALGAILYEMLGGRPPFQADSTVEMILQVVSQDPPSLARCQPQLPRDLVTICMRCLQKEPHQRYASAGALADDLRRFRAGEPIEARRVSEWERAWKWARRRPKTAALVFLVLAMAGLGFPAVTGLWIQAERAEAREAEQRRQAERAHDRAEQALAFSQVAQALSARRLNNVAASELLLDHCLPARRGWEWHLLKGLNHSDLLTVPPRPGWAHVYALAYSPDGTRLALAGGNPFLRQPVGGAVVVDAATGTQRLALAEPAGDAPSSLATAVAFSPDGRTLLTAGFDGRLRLWDATDGRLVRVLKGHAGGPVAAAFSPDGECIASLSVSDRMLRLWDARTGTQTRTKALLDMGPERAAGSNVVFSPDGTRLGYSDGKQIYLEEPATGVVKWQRNGYGWLAFQPSGERLASASANHIRVWSFVPKWPFRHLSGGEGEFRQVQFSPDGRSVASAGTDGTVRLWDLDTGLEQAVYRGHAGRVRAVCFHPAGHALASAGEQPAEVKVWDRTAPPEYAHFRFGGDGLAATQAIAFDATGRYLRSAHSLDWARGQLSARDVETGRTAGEHVFDLLGQWLTPARVAAFSGDGGRLAAVAGDPRLVRLYDAESGRLQATLEGHRGPVYHLSLSHTGHRIATGGTHGPAETPTRELFVWNADAGRPLVALTVPALPTVRLGEEGHGRNRLCGAVAISPDGAWLAYDEYRTEDRPGGRLGLIEAVVKVRDARTGQECGTLPTGRPELVSDLAFSPDARYLAAAVEAGESPAGQVVLWEWATGRRLHERPLEGPATQLAFSPDGRRLAGVDREQVKVWDVVGGNDLLVLRGAEPRPSDNGFNPKVAWSPDGRRLAVSNYDRSVSLWDSAGRTTPAEKASLRRAAEGRAFAWHLRRARECLEPVVILGHAPHVDRASVRQHRDWLAAADPPDARLRLERGRLHALLGETEPMKADFARAAAERPDDPWLFRRRAATYRELKQWAEAEADLRRVIELCPGDPLERIALAHLHVERGRWAEAAAEYERAFALGPPPVAAVYWPRTSLLLLAEDADGYRRHCAAMAERLTDIRGSSALEALAHALALGEPAPGDRPRVLELARLRRERGRAGPWTNHVQGLAEYRAGEYASAVRTLRRAIADDPNWKEQILNRLALALALHADGRVAEAERELATADEWLNRTAAELPPDTLNGVPKDWRWWDWLEVRLLRREAALKMTR